MKAIIYWSKSSGLANRLRALAGYRALSYFLDVPFYLCWMSDPTCDSHFEQLFDPNGIELITPEQKDALVKDQKAQVYTANQWFTDIWKTNATEAIPWEPYRKQSVHFLQQIHPVSHIVEKVENFSERQNLQNTSAIHIRLTDNIQTYAHWTQASSFNPEHISQLEGFEQFIYDNLEHNHAFKIFLATDNLQVETQLRYKFRDHILIYPKEYRNDFKWSFSWKRLRFYRQLQRTSSIEVALIELLLLSKCCRIAGTYWSSYSQLSALWGDVEFFVVRGNRYVKDDIVARLKGEIPLEENNPVVRPYSQK